MLYRVSLRWVVEWSYCVCDYGYFIVSMVSTTFCPCYMSG